MGRVIDNRNVVLSGMETDMELLRDLAKSNFEGLRIRTIVIVDGNYPKGGKQVERLLDSKDSLQKVLLENSNFPEGETNVVYICKIDGLTPEYLRGIENPAFFCRGFDNVYAWFLKDQDVKDIRLIKDYELNPTYLMELEELVK